MAISYFGSNYNVVATTVTFTPKDSQFGPGAGGDPIEPMFFGIGGDELRTTPFSVGGPVVMDLPFLGETEVLTARLFGELGARMGLEITAGLEKGADDPEDPDLITPGQIAAVLPYDLVVAYPTLAPDIASGDLIDLFFDTTFNPGASAETGFQTRFPSLIFEMNLINELDVVLGAEVGILGSNTTFTPVDFNASTSIPLISVDTARLDDEGGADPLNVLGVGTQNIISLLGLEPIENANGEFRGISVPLNAFFDTTLPEDRADASTGVTGDQPTGRVPERPEIDIGRIELFVPNINVASKEVDGVYVADPGKRVVNGVIEDDATGRGNKDDLAALVLDLDGLTTLATGGAFPPLELGWELFNSNNGETDEDASPFELAIDFYYNLLDVELRAAFPLAQEFELTPEIATKVSFFEATPEGEKGDAVAVQVAQTKKQLLFDASGSFTSDAVAQRLSELAAQSTQVARDIELFVDLERAIPGAFTGDVGGVSAVLGISRDGGPFEPLDALGNAPIIESAPQLGANQNVDLDLTGVQFGYIISSQINGPETTEVIPVAFDPDSTVFRLVDVEAPAGLTETDFLSDLSALNVIYGGEQIFVEVETEARPIVRSTTGLEFDLSLLLSGLEFEAGFNASVDLGPFSVGVGLDLGVGPLFDETIPLFNADLITLFDETFSITDSRTTSFLLGGDEAQGELAPGAIVGTEDDDNVDAVAVAAAQQQADAAQVVIDDTTPLLAAAVAAIPPAQEAANLAGAQFAAAQATLSQFQVLFNRGLVSAADLQEATDNRNQAQANVAQANALLNARVAERDALQQTLDQANADLAAANVILASAGNPELRGTAQADVIVGLAGDDRLLGLEGDDTLFPGEGADTVDGGDGIDTVDFSDLTGAVLTSAHQGLLPAGARAGINVLLNDGVETAAEINSDGTLGAVTEVSNVERWRLTDFADVLRLDLASPGDLAELRDVSTLGGDDVVEATGLFRREVTAPALNIDLGDGDDRFIVGDQNGSDLAQLAPGMTLLGGAGTDTLVASGVVDLQAGTGPDGVTFSGFENITRVSGTFGTLLGDDGANRLQDSAGDGFLAGRGGADILLGEAGNDVLIGGLGADVLDGGAGLDTASYADSTTSIFIREVPGAQMLGFRGEAQGDVLIDIERIEGSAFNDLFRGGERSMIIEGGAGDDRIVAGGGNDTIFGQDGNDLLLRAEEGRVSGTNTFDGGDGFDLLGGFEGGVRLASGSVSGTVRFVNRDPRGILPFRDENVDRTGTFTYQAVVEQFLRVRMADGVAEIIEEDVNSNAIFTSVSVNGRYNYTERGLFNIETDWRNVNIQTVEQFGFTRSALLASSNDFVDGTGRDSLRTFIADNVSGVSSSDIVSTFYSSDIRSIGSLSSTDRVLSRDTFTNVEGIIGTDRDDEMFGSAADEAFYGNGGDDYVEAAAGDDILGFGEGQALKNLTNPPGDTAVPVFGRQGGTIEPQNNPTILERLRTLDPDDAVAGASRATVTGDVDGAGNTRVDWGSFLWGGAGIDTLDLRFDRGLNFLPTDGPEARAIVDLDAAPTNTTINTFTGERVVYGTAVFTNPGEDETAPGSYVNATLFGIENVLGTANNDIISGDARDNRIEGGGGADTMDGRGGTDTASYALASEGVELNLVRDGAGVRLDNSGGGTGDAAGDTAVGFERFEGSGFADTVTLTGVVTTGTKNISFDVAHFFPEVTVPSGIPGNDETFQAETRVFTETVPMHDTLLTPATPLVTLALGDGDDVLTAGAGTPVVADLGDGADTVHLTGVVHDIDLGAGDDMVSVAALPDGALTGRSAAQRTTFIDGGDGVDTVRFASDAFVSLQSDGAGRAIVTVAAEPAATETTAFINSRTFTDFIFPFTSVQRTSDLIGEIDITGQASFTDALDAIDASPAIYDLTNVEFIEIDGARIRLNAADPVVDADTTLTITEDARDPFDLGIIVPAAERSAGATYRIDTLPETAQIALPEGFPGSGPVAEGDVLTAEELAALQVIPGQLFGGVVDQLVFERVNPPEPEDARIATLPSVAPLDGVSLNITAPVSPDGDPLTVTLTQAPDSGTLFVMRPDPGFLALGVTMPMPVAVTVGDTLTVEELAGLSYRPAENATGSVGAVAYEVDTGLGLRELSQTTGTDDAPAERDGRASQTITIEITPVDDAPEVARLLYPISPNGVLEATLNVADAEDDPFTLSVEQAPTLGALTLNADGSFVYRQDGVVDFAGADFVEDRFSVRATQDGSSLASPAVTQVVRIINPASQAAIVFDTTRPDVFFDDQGDPIALGGLGTDDTVIGHDGNDQLFGFGGKDRILGLEGDDTLSGGSGNDRLNGGDGNDAIEGGAGDDILFGKAGDDTLDGGAGDDELIGSDGNDEINGEAGNDILRGGAGNDVIEGGAGDDTVFGGNDEDIINGGVGDDMLGGNGGSDIINGGSGDDMLIGGLDGDVLDGGDGADELRGGGGDDTLWGGDGDDLMFGSFNDDVLYGGAGDDVLNGNTQVDALFGEAGNDILRGGDGFDSLDGGTGNDTLEGGNGKDVLNGGSGQDILRGQAQNDTFVFAEASDSAFGSADLIDGFEGVGVRGGDLIDVSMIDANIAVAGMQSFVFLGALSTAEGFAAGAGALWVEDFGTQTRLYGLVDDDNSIDLAVRINDGATTTASDYFAGDFIV
ncbi:calcium-binding protein [Roseobacter denitrificans]|uniref:Iron-regulated protein frpC, putative n=1 Tax=Roseobacter denitrificans (strain ATCC 33942 / OCh 114) TaxID=375451 RepID=Q164L5_ROSDO|nr:Ig-like domain-containing protein [Roseobacter denitrificans]ABG32578.1 iron-regulated protein frpC, putative [Roseobacter denitrificans OCh 114]AVL52026.1 calcium-binding protein [Roseobacter denitrificans]SFF92484.1 Ca2+-binding protein, RTX toxin-related [Roseobacter denitrificans OCh 114]